LAEFLQRPDAEIKIAGRLSVERFYGGVVQMNRTVAIHQPNFLPWLGYFWKMAHCDVFIVLNYCQFSNNSYTNRTQIKTQAGAKWLTVPLKKPKLIPINKVITATGEWRSDCWNLVKENYRHTPFFKRYENLLEALFHHWHTDLFRYNYSWIDAIQNILGIETMVIKSSLIHLEKTGCDRIIDLVKAVGGTVYLSGSGAESYNDAKLFEANQIELRYGKFEHPIYPQQHGEFVAGLSVIDALLNCGEDRVREMLGIV
jgi:hypothetical protein